MRERVLDSAGSGLGPMVGSYEHGSEPSIIGRELLDQLSDYHFLKMDSTVWRY
jgi:hypothetical protein